MLRICEDTHVYCAILRGKSKKHIFEEEIQKKKMLDVVVNIQSSMGFRILAYCILDDEMHLILENGDMDNILSGIAKIQEQYEANCPGRIKMGQGKLWRNYIIREISVEWRAVRCCIGIHVLPVKRKLVSRPEDYWWCSYRDYMGRKWLNLTDTEILLSWIDGDVRKATKIFKAQHQKKKFVRG